MPRYASSWASVAPNTVPCILTETVPGPKSQALNTRGMRHMIGYSSQVTLCPSSSRRGTG